MKKRFPFSSNPVGWYAVALGEQLTVGGVLPLSYFGQDLVAFRGDDGVARVLDAYCPHLGAHLGHGGVVEGASIRCPFHGSTSRARAPARGSRTSRRSRPQRA